MEPLYLLQDILTLSFVFNDLERFNKVVDMIVREIQSIIVDHIARGLFFIAISDIHNPTV